MKQSKIHRLERCLGGVRSQLELLWLAYIPEVSFEGRTTSQLIEALYARYETLEKAREPANTNILFKWNPKTGNYECGKMCLTRQYVEDGIDL